MTWLTAGGDEHVVVVTGVVLVVIVDGGVGVVDSVHCYSRQEC